MQLRTLRCQRRGTGQELSRLHGEILRTLGLHVQQRRHWKSNPRVRLERAGLGLGGLRQAHGGERAWNGGVREARGAGVGEVREHEPGRVWDTRELCFARAGWDAIVEGHVGV